MNCKTEPDTVHNSMSELEAEDLHILLDITNSLYHHVNFDEMVSYVVKRVQEILDSETASVILYDEVEDVFRFSWVVNSEHADKLIETTFPANQGIAGSVFKSRQPELILDVSKDPRHYKRVDSDTGFKTRSMMVAPLQGRERAIGVIQVLNKRDGVFSKRDLNFLISITRLIGLALDNAQMHAELSRAYNKQLEVIEREKTLLLERAQERNIQLQREVEACYRFDHIKGKSEQIANVLRLCEKVMGCDISVLIRGETGTGKELIARCIHYNSHRKGMPFIVQNCGAIPETLLASELFGYKKGAFTGAVKDKRGLFEVADGGTVFLDEVGEIPPSMQVSLLRALEEGEVKPLGADYYKKVDVRIISATNRDIEKWIKKGKFREDLFYRIGAFTITVPPLRERKEDIPILVQHFIKEFNRRNNRSFRGLTPDALRGLTACSFPGNIRELENEIQRAMAMAGDRLFIGLHHFSERICAQANALLDKASVPNTLKEKVVAFEKAEILKAMEKHQKNKTKVASELGLSRLGLMKKLGRYDLM